MVRRHWQLAISGTAALFALSLATETAHAGDVRGSVRTEETARPKAVEAIRAPYFQEWNGFIEPKKTSVDFARDVAVVLVGASPTRDASIVTLQNGTLTPSTIVVQQGTSLRVRNQDDFTHKLVCEKVKGFDAVNTSPGATREIAMLETGHFVIEDRVAPHVKGHLHVIAKVTAVAAPSADGSYSFKDVPPGKYTLLVFRGGAEVSSSEIEVEGSRTVEVDPISVELKSAK